MIEDNFGATIDIHGGGLDLIFPHHENEIAQSKCAHEGKSLANYWMHNGYLTVDGTKMSKSLGNYVTVHDLIKEFPNRGEAIRLCLLTAQYRQPVDFSREGIRQAEKQLNRWYKAVEGVIATKEDVSDKVLNALHDDLNTPKVIMELGQLAKEGNGKALLASARLIGLLDNEDWFVQLEQVGDLSAETIEKLIQQRIDAKVNKDWALADQIRNDLDAGGIALLDSADGTSWTKK
jgi:cysteinyl-tRNA synthetase